MKRLRILVWLLTPLLIAPAAAVAQSTFFTANLTSEQVSPPFGAEGDPAGSPFTGTAGFTFTPGATPTLTYQIVLPGMDLDGSLTPANLDDDVTAIHIHFGAAGSNGQHGLNVLGLAGGQIREDDADMMVNVGAHTVSGIWDNGDQMFTGPGGTKLAPDSIALADAVDALLAGELYLQVHTLNFPSGELRGQIVPVPEPAIILTLSLGVGVIWLRRRALL